MKEWKINKIVSFDCPIHLWSEGTLGLGTTTDSVQGMLSYYARNQTQTTTCKACTLAFGDISPGEKVKVAKTIQCEKKYLSERLHLS